MKKCTLKKVGLLAGALITVAVVLHTHQADFAHCQIPCGIYNDDVRFSMMEEHVTTIEKSTRLISQLSHSSPESNTNQIVRWVANKEHHADELAEIVVQYFLQQRVKPVAEGSGAKREKYVKQLTLCHGLLVTSMKAKQSTDLAHAGQLRKLIAEFKKSYLN